MIGMIRRILGVSGKYKGRIYGAMGFSFLKGLLMKVPIILTYFIVTTYIDGTLTKKTALYGAIALVASIIKHESKFLNDVHSSRGAIGLMQIMPETFDWLQEKRGEAGKYTTEDLYTPSVNIDYGSYLLRYFLDYYGNEKCAVAAYNAGFEVSNWLEDPNCSPDGMTLDVIPYPETSEYVVKVENAKQKYIELYFS